MLKKQQIADFQQLQITWFYYDFLTMHNKLIILKDTKYF